MKAQRKMRAKKISTDHVEPYFKRSHAVTLVSIIFILSPIFMFVTPMPSGHFIPMMMVFSGLCLLIQRKTAWALAAVSLLMVITYTGISVLPNKSFTPFIKIVDLSVLVALGVLLYHFRFPYLDRRGHWIHNAPRLEVEIPCKLLPANLTGTIENLSQTGAWIEVQHKRSKLVTGEHLTIKASGMDLEAKIIRSGPNHIGVEFHHTDNRQMEKFQTFFQKLCNSH